MPSSPIPHEEEAKTLNHESLTVTFERFQAMKNMLIARLRSAEHENHNTEEEEGNTSASIGMRQIDLLRWYMDEQAVKGQFSNMKEMANEYKLIKTVVQHLIRREGTLIIIEEPAPEEGVPANRLIDLRIIAINPNFGE